MTSRDKRRSLWIVLACFLVLGVGVTLVTFPDDIFARYLAFVGLAILGGGAAISISNDSEKLSGAGESGNRRYRILRRSALFVVLFFFSFFWFPLLGGGGEGSALLSYLWMHNTLFPFGLSAVGADAGTRYLESTAIFGALLFWLIVASTFGFATKKRSLKFSALLAYPVMIALTVAVNYSLYLGGFAAAYSSFP